MKNRLKELRAALKITQFEMADKANIGRSTYAMFETGDRIPKDIHISAICAATGASADWLRTGIGAMFALSDDSTLDQLVAKHHLRPMEKTILEAFVKLPEGYRDGVMEYIKALVAAVIADCDKQAEHENQSLHDHPAFNLPTMEDGEEKAHA